jgi:very-short-patch-repair endonuclease
VLGDGRLRWQATGGAIDHPVLLQRVELEFDPDVPEFRVIDADRAAELHGALLQGGEGISAQTLNELRAELEAGGYHPLAKAATSGYLRRLAQLLGPRGSFRDERADGGAGPDPVVHRDPALFLRARLSGFPAAFDRVFEDLETRDDLPLSLTRLVGVALPAGERQPAPATSPWSEPPDVLLSKPANLEQVEIARALEAHRAVLVQGPPGRDLQPGDLRAALIEHVRDPSARRRAIQEAQRHAESLFETAVMERLIGAGYRVEPQLWVGQYRIDMVVSGGKEQGALECDGDRFHGVDEIPLDMARQAVLERAGWRFIRVRGTRFYRDPDSTMAWVFEELERRGIAPDGSAATTADVDAEARAARERIVARAWEIMRGHAWLPVGSDGQAAG